MTDKQKIIQYYKEGYISKEDMEFQLGRIKTIKEISYK